jgi:hypothetical protein
VVVPDGDPDLEALIRCLEQRPADRPQQAREIRAALEAVARRRSERAEARRPSVVIPVLVGIILALLTDAVVHRPPPSPRSAAGAEPRCPASPNVRASHVAEPPKAAGAVE